MRMLCANLVSNQLISLRSVWGSRKTTFFIHLDYVNNVVGSEII